MKQSRRPFTLSPPMAMLGIVGAVAVVGVSMAMNAQPKAGAEQCRYTYQSDQPNIAKIEAVDFADAFPGLEKGKRVKVAAVLKTLNNQYWQGIAEGIRAGARDFGADVTIQAATTEVDPTQQLTIAQTLIGRQFDAYIFSPETVSNLTPAILQLQDNCVPIVNTDDARIGATTYVGPNHELYGSQVADLFASRLPNGGDIAQIEGKAGSSAAILRIKGFKEGIAKYPKLKLVASVPGNWEGTMAYANAQTLLRKNPNIKAFYANNDTMAIGVAKAISDMGLTGKVMVVGTDGVPAALDGIKRGTMTATETPLPFYQGYWSVEAAVRLARGQKVPPWVVAPAQMITNDNLGDFFTADYSVKQGLYK